MNSNIRTRRKWNRVVLFLVSCYFVKYSLSSPIFSSQFSQFQSARNLRNLPCRVKRSGLQGVCMFAIDCIKSNGTHLGTCIDKFYFGSCCQMKLQDVDSIYNPEISDNSIDSSSPSDSMSSKPYVPVSSTTISVSSVHSRTTPPASASKQPSLSYNNKTFELIPTTKTPSHAETSTAKYTISVGGFTTTLGTILEKNYTSSITLPTSTENSRISTFQTILDEKSTTTTRKPPSTAFNRTKKPPAKPTAASSSTRPSKKPVSQLQPLNRTSVSSESTSSSSSSAASTAAASSITTGKPPSPSSTVKVTKRPLTTVRPTKNATSTVIKTTRKPVASTNVTVNRRTTLSSRRNSTLTTTRRPTTTTTTASSTTITNQPSRISTSSTTAQPPTVSTVAAAAADSTTKFPRPRPTPAEHIVKVDSSTLSAEDLISTASLPDETSSAATRKPPAPTTTSTVKSTIVTRRTTKRPQTAPPTAATTTTAFSTVTKPLTDRPSTFSSDTTSMKEDDAASSTEKVAQVTQQHKETTSGPELVTWTLGNAIVSNSSSKGDEWVLVSSLAPSDVKPLISSTSTTTATVAPVDSKITEMPSSSNLTQLAESTTGKVTSVEDVSSSVSEKVRETTSSTTTTSTSATIIELEEEELEEEEEESEENEENEEDAITGSSEEAEELPPLLSSPPSEDVVKNSTVELSENEIAVSTQPTEVTASTAAPISVNLTSNAPVDVEEEEEEEEEIDEEETVPPSSQIESTTASTTTTTTTSSTAELLPDETRPVDPFDDTTMWPVTERSNYTSTELHESSANTTESGDALGVNETSPPKHPSSAASSLEGLDYRQICGRRMFPEARIVGGARAAFGRWPWQISLRQWRTSTYLHKCGSALLNENWAISAAHCVDNVPPSDLLLRMGEYDLSIEEEPYGYQERRVQIVASHPQFDPRTFEYDLALLRFYEPVVFQPNIIPVCVPEKDEDFIGRTAYVTGWGRLYEDGPLPSTLQEVTVPVIRNDICESMYRNAGYIEHIPHIFICAGHKQGAKDSCEGDSGGPMVIQREDKRFQLAGIISWGIGCAEPNQPGVYTRISEFRDWINQILMF